jgi:hypothetical protein
MTKVAAPAAGLLVNYPLTDFCHYINTNPTWTDGALTGTDLYLVTPKNTANVFQMFSYDSGTEAEIGIFVSDEVIAGECASVMGVWNQTGGGTYGMDTLTLSP